MRTTILAIVLVALHHGSARADSAEELFDAGQRAYDGGDYALAIGRWEESFRLSKEPGLLFNIAQAYRRAGNCTRALSSYQQFVASDPSSDRRQLADELVRELEGTCGSRQATRQPTEHVEIQQPSTKDSGRNLRVAGLVTGGAGTALVVTGLLFGRRASAIGDEVSHACAQTCDWAEQKGKDGRGRRYATVGYVLDTVGVAAIAAGAITYYLGVRHDGIVAVPRGQEGGVVVTWSGQW